MENQKNKNNAAVRKEPQLGKKVGLNQDNSTPRNIEVHKPVWAAYANMARQNIYQTLCHISHVLGYEVNKNDRDLESELIRIPAIKILHQEQEQTQDPKQKKKKQKKAGAEVIAKSIQMLDKHFPFLEPMLEKLIQIKNNEKSKEREKLGSKNKTEFIPDKTKTPELYYELFNYILPVINLFRDYYSHNILIDNRITVNGKIIDKDLQVACDKLSAMLDFCVTGARRIVKERFTVGENAAFEKTDFDFFEGGNHYFDYIKVNEDGFALLDEKGRMQKIKREKKSYIYKIGTRGDKDKYTRLTNMGIYLLFCLFLNKKYAKEFGDKIDFWGSQLRNKPSKKVISIMHETASVFRMHLPKDRLQSEKDQSAIGLDMLNELKKCPKELFETLSAKDRDKFRVPVKQNGGEEEEENATVLLLRSFDRFPTLALQYLDSMEKFRYIRFQVDLGNYRYKFYEKKNWIDKFDEESAGRVRILQKELTGYGRLNEIEQQRKKKWEGLIRTIDQPRADSSDSKPYITDHHASYHLEGNHIGLQWNTRGQGILDESGIFMPSIELAEDNKKAPLYAPKCRLSVHDLPAVCFLTLLHGSGSKAERLIIDTTEKYQKFFRALATGEIIPYNKETKESFIPLDIKEAIRKAREEARKRGGRQDNPISYIIEPYGIELASLPRKIQDYLLEDSFLNDGNARFKRLSEERLMKMLEFTDRKLKSIKETKKMYASKDNKLGKKSHVDIRQGTLARFLAKDMVFFKRPDADGAIVLTSQNFDILQKELALFNKPLSGLKRLFVTAELIGCKSDEENHPFLQKVLNRNPASFLDFYITYLSERKVYLEKLIVHARALWNEQEIKPGSGAKEKLRTEFHFLHPERAKWDDRNAAFYKELASRYTTIELPGNLFLDTIVEELKKIDTTTLEKPQILTDALTQENKNTAFLINAYMQAMGDGHQPFYGYKRSYKYFTMTYKPNWDFSNPIEKLTDKYLTIGQMEKFISDNDSVAREKFYISSLERRTATKVTRAKGKGKYNDRKKSLEEEFLKNIAEAHEKLSHSLKFYKENEREIRRVKVQDEILFLMAKDVLTKTMDKINLKEYKLRLIGSNGNTDILSMQLPFAVKLRVKTADKSTKEVTIHQADLKLKNYGDFFRFIYDSRIQPLLAHVDAQEIEREELEKELDNYDMKRIPIFTYIHELEGRVCETLDKAQFHIDADDKPVKVDFRYLMDFVNIKENNKVIIKSIRNAFCHNNYPKGENMSLIFEKEKAKENECSLPNVAITMADNFKQLAKAATPKQKK